jgi:hypothetical protein
MVGLSKTTSSARNRRIINLNITPANRQIRRTNEFCRILISPFADIEELLAVVDRKRSSASRAPTAGGRSAIVTTRLT